ncbi:hypothetical protein NPIL_547831 [Nephila pilipes]|uniref:Uncharacterized protein n=1 Tax=Nephila pilipes TaxID=299642 RepID=A0A8X6PU40_NEPPI|nr:hypothetical protein NPIL_547831 [Nephila pilipes]
MAYASIITSIRYCQNHQSMWRNCDQATRYSSILPQFSGGIDNVYRRWSFRKAETGLTRNCVERCGDSLKTSPHPAPHLLPVRQIFEKNVTFEKSSFTFSSTWVSIRNALMPRRLHYCDYFGDPVDKRTFIYVREKGQREKNRIRSRIWISASSVLLEAVLSRNNRAFLVWEARVACAASDHTSPTKEGEQDESETSLSTGLPHHFTRRLHWLSPHRDNGTGRKQWNGPPLVPSRTTTLSFANHRVLGR